MTDLSDLFIVKNPIDKILYITFIHLIRDQRDLFCLILAYSENIHVLLNVLRTKISTVDMNFNVFMESIKYVYFYSE